MRVLLRLLSVGRGEAAAVIECPSLDKILQVSKLGTFVT